MGQSQRTETLRESEMETVRNLGQKRQVLDRGVEALHRNEASSPPNKTASPREARSVLCTLGFTT